MSFYGPVDEADFESEDKSKLFYDSKSDFKHFVNANKALGITSIVLIVATNALVMWKHVRKPKFHFSVKNRVIISLAVGDILLALCPLVLTTIYLFKPELFIDQNCRIIQVVGTYVNFLIHFVFALGLMVLWAEILLRNKLRKILYGQSPVVALLASSLPWVLGLLIVVPLCLTRRDNTMSISDQFMSMLFNVMSRKGNYLSQRGDDFLKASKYMSSGGMYIEGAVVSYCKTIHSQETIFTVSVFVPAALALAMSIVLLHVNTNEQGADRVVYPHPEQRRDLTVDKREMTAEHRTLIHLPPEQTVFTDPRDSNPVYESKSNRRKEKIRLLVITVVYFVLVIPYGAFLLSYDIPFDNWVNYYQAFLPSNTNVTSGDWVNYYKVLTSLVWIMVARSWVTPIIFLLFRV